MNLRIEESGSNERMDLLSKELKEANERQRHLKLIIKKLKKVEIDQEREIRRLTNPKET